MSVRHPSFRVLRGLLAIPLVLAGCAQQPRHHANDSFDRIDRDLQTAVDSHAGKPAASGAKATAADALLPPLAMELPKPAAAVVEPRFDLTVSNAPAAQVFMAIVSGTRYSMLLPADLAGTLSVSLKDVTVPEALEAIRELYGYDFRVSGTRVYVQPNTLQTRVFQVNYLAGRRQGMSDLRVTTSSISAAQAPGGSAAGQPAPGTSSTRLGADSSRVSTSTDNDFWADLKAALGALVGSEGGRSVVLNPSSGVIVVRGMPQDIRGV